MALRDQPYIPLYIQDFLTDEKLIECSAQATGVYIRLMCIMHKSEEYGTILLRQKDKQTTEQIKNFADKLGKQMPFAGQVIYDSLKELLNEKVIEIEGDVLRQKRMIEDNKLSLKRSTAGQKGGFATAKVKAKPLANNEANTEIEYVIENENVIEFGIKKEYSIFVRAKYAGEKTKRIYDLRTFFESTGQLQQLEKAKLDKFDLFMESNPAAIFDEDSHVYNSFKKFCTATNGHEPKKRNIDHL